MPCVGFLSLCCRFDKFHQGGVCLLSGSQGRYLFETFPVSRSGLALSPEWNMMTKLSQWQIRPETTILEGYASPMGIGLPGGQIQKFVLNRWDLLKP